jgi:hypothetical protein
LEARDGSIDLAVAERREVSHAELVRNSLGRHHPPVEASGERLPLRSENHHADIPGQRLADRGERAPRGRRHRVAALWRRKRDCGDAVDGPARRVGAEAQVHASRRQRRICPTVW